VQLASPPVFGAVASNTRRRLERVVLSSTIFFLFLRHLIMYANLLTPRVGPLSRPC